MNSDNPYEELKYKIHHLTTYAWNKKVDWLDVEAWLSNFTFDEDIELDERIQMLYLLSQTMFFGEREVRELLKSIYRDKYKYGVVEKIRLDNHHTVDSSLIEEKFIEALNKTRFLGVGNPSESGTHLLYFFRQENKLRNDLFINTSEIFRIDKSSICIRDMAIKRYVFIDDLCGSGDQICDYLKDIVIAIKDLNPAAAVYYFPIFSMSGGLNKIKVEVPFDEVDCVFELDESFKCFSSESRYFTTTQKPISKERVEEVAAKYGKRLLPYDFFGFKGGQLLLVFNHNTPDNTLPIIWYDEGYVPWEPIFKRFNKEY